MNSTRMWTLVSVVVILALVAGTWFVGISPRLDEASAANAERSNVEAQNAIHESKLAALELQASQLDELKAELAELQQSVPDRANLSILIGQVNSIAASTGVSIAQLTTGDAASFISPTAEVANPELAAALSGVTSDTFFTIPVGINLAGKYEEVMRFVDRLQHGERLILVHGLSLTKGKAVSGATVEYSLTGQIFVLLGNSPETDAEEATEAVAAG